jgi:hypothetical protein
MSCFNASASFACPAPVYVQRRPARVFAPQITLDPPAHFWSTLFSELRMKLEKWFGPKIPKNN